MLPLSNTRNGSLKPNQAGVESLGARGSGTGGVGRAGEEQSRMDLGSSRVSHIHTLRVETGY